jgi:hypothetical protein
MHLPVSIDWKMGRMIDGSDHAGSCADHAGSAIMLISLHNNHAAYHDGSCGCSKSHHAGIMHGSCAA